MSDTTAHHLTAEQIRRLETQGCRAQDWSKVLAAQPLDTDRLQQVRFSGEVTLGRFEKTIRLFGGVELRAGIANATIHNCRIGNNAFINNIENYIANYDIEDDVLIDHVSLLAVEGESTFGNGVEVAVINEMGGREIPIYDGLSSHVGYLLALYRHRPVLIEKLRTMIARYVESVRSARGRIGAGTRLSNCKLLTNIRVGPCAVIEGASLLDNGSINSCPEDPARIGVNVIARDFILSSGSEVGDNSILAHCFVGQGTQLSKQYSAENSVFFANCGGFHGEACSIFAGPYTVTHHKSTLLIAGIYSFLNAGSGSNQSNHMYKLGPCHQGVVERGSKTTSDSYMLWPAKVGPFTMVMGRHYGNSDTSNLPYSYLIESEDESVCIPGVNLRSVGTVRDSRKWPKRDRRKDPRKLDFIIFNLLTPFTVQKMINGRKLLAELRETSGRTSQHFYFNGVKIKRSSLENGIEFYRLGTVRFLGNLFVQHIRQNNFTTMQQLRDSLVRRTPDGSETWLDLAGLLAPHEVIERLLAEIESGAVNSEAAVQDHLRGIYERYEDYQWTWVLGAIERHLGKTTDQFTAEDVIGLIHEWIGAVEKLDRMRREDACKEFGLTSRIGFGIDGNETERDLDFEAIRGTDTNNSFIQELDAKLKAKKKTVQELFARLEHFS
jgi:hypothetical protein